MKALKPAIVCVTPGSNTLYFSCNPCSPDELRDGSQCNPCNPCSPDQIRDGSQCNPCHPCSPDQLRGGSQCNPCSPCSPDQMRTGGQCNPCSPCSPDQVRGGNSSGGSSCFISSACAESMGLPDDCDKLQALRLFRDRRKTEDPAFAALVEEYYRIAPPIVEWINSKPDSKNEFLRLYKELVVPCVELIKNAKEDEAINLYTSQVRQLQARFENSHE